MNQDSESLRRALESLLGKQPPQPIHNPNWNRVFPAPKPAPKLPLRIAPPKPKPVVRIARQRVFVSFDWHLDKRYKFLLSAWNANPRFQFVFNDHSSREINSWDIGRIKAGLTAKINDATHTLVIIGAEANKPHKDRLLIGTRNWINFEVRQSRANNNKIAAIKLNWLNESPEELKGAKVAWARSFNEPAIIQALRDA